MEMKINLIKVRNAPVMLAWRLGIVMLVYSFQRLIFFLLNAGFFPGMTSGHLLELMISGIKFDLSAVLYTNSLYILLMLLPFSFRYHDSYRKYTRILFFVTNGIAFFANFIDVVYFRNILRRTDFSVFREFQHESQIWKIVLHSLWQYWYLLLLFVGLMLFLRWVYSDHKSSGLVHSRLIYLVGGIIFAGLCGGLTVAGMRGGFTGTTRPITISNALEKIQKPIESSIVLNTPFSMIRTIKAQTFEELNFFEEKELEKIYSPLHPGYPKGSFKPMNVVVLILESFTKEVVGSMNSDLDNGHYKGYTPFLDSLIQHSYTWKYSFANGRQSIDAIPSVIAGIPSLVQPFVTSRYSLNEMDGLAATLKHKGYDAGFFHGAPNGSMGFNSITNMLSIKKYFGENEYGRTQDFDGYWGIPDELFLNFCANNFGKLKEPFVASVFTLSSHDPFILPKKYENVFKGGADPLYKCIEYSDYSLREFFKEASTKPWYKNTLFVLTADHSLASKVRNEYLTTTGIFSIPIIFYHPGSELVGQDPTLMQQIDIFPTIMGYLKYDAPYFAFGNDRLLQKDNPFVVNYVNGYYQFMEGDYLLQSDGKTLMNAWNYKTDHTYQNNLVNKGDTAIDLHFKRFKAFLQQYNNRMVENRLKIK